MAREYRKRKIDVRRAIELHHVCDGPAKGWLHTHGLAAHGHPELEIRNVPLFLGPLASGLLNSLADHVLNGSGTPLRAGEALRWGKSEFRVMAAQPDEDGGYDPNHYLCVRLTLVDLPDVVCRCEECLRLASAAMLPS